MLIKKYKKYQKKNNLRRRKRSFKENNIKINYKVIFIIIIMAIISLIFIKLGLYYEKNIKPVYNYTVQKSDEYEILLKPNSFYTTKTLPSGRIYASQSIDLYKINLKYNFKGKEKSDIEYNYNIKANLVSTVNNNENQGKEIWNREFVILENNNKKSNDDTFSINENFDINYGYYNNLSNSYQKEYKIKVDTVLKVRLNVSYNVNLNKLGVENEIVNDYVEVDIPITNTVTEVKENYEKNISKEIASKNINIYFIISGLFTLADIVLIIISIKKLQKKMNLKNQYERNIKRILKYYSDLIVTVTNEPDLSNFKVMDISILDDLIDLAEQNQTNIIQYEVIEDEESKLYVFVDNFVYKYLVTANTLL